MNIWIRADASSIIGTGHIMRCLTLADCVRTEARITFLCGELDGNLISYIRGRGYSAYSIQMKSGNWEEDAKETVRIIKLQTRKVDLLIVDHYGLDARYESDVRPYVGSLAVIDDLADRPHACDLLLDQNAYENAIERYEGKVGKECRLLLGPVYALIKPDFTRVRMMVKRTGEIRRVLVTFGGADRTGETMKTLEAIDELARRSGRRLHVEVLLGKINPHGERIRRICERMSDTECYEHVENVADRMLQADLAIGSGGTTTWERCCVGLPSLVVTTADNQLELSAHASKLGIIYLLGTSEQVDSAMIRDRLEQCLDRPQAMREMSARGFEIVDGLGAGRVIRELLACLNK